MSRLGIPSEVSIVDRAMDDLCALQHYLIMRFVF